MSDISESAPHEWLAPGEHPNTSKWTCCALCGRVKRADGRPDSSCPGLVRIELRAGRNEKRDKSVAGFWNAVDRYQAGHQGTLRGRFAAWLVGLTPEARRNRRPNTS